MKNNLSLGHLEVLGVVNDFCFTSPEFILGAIHLLHQAGTLAPNNNPQNYDGSYFLNFALLDDSIPDNVEHFGIRVNELMEFLIMPRYTHFSEETPYGIDLLLKQRIVLEVPGMVLNPNNPATYRLTELFDHVHILGPNPLAVPPGISNGRFMEAIDVIIPFRIWLL